MSEHYRKRGGDAGCAGCVPLVVALIFAFLSSAYVVISFACFLAKLAASL
ncbi:hypothetical protein [Adlercreutzia sp. ZJ242]|nr:hypothetical protein [Adlercreutzia sp. ZJ242]